MSAFVNSAHVDENTAPRMLPLQLPFRWAQGEHMTITGDTGSGKTTLANTLMYARRNTLILKTKADKAPLPGKLIKTSREFERGNEPRYVLEPLYARQRSELARAFFHVWKVGQWSVYIDELFYLCEQLKLGSWATALLTQGRSNNITVISGMQRPANVTRYAMSQSTHLIAFGAEGRDVKILDEVGGRRWATTVASLGRYEFAWYYRPTRAVWRGTVQRLLAE